jgi:hypothetical protein
MEIATLSKNESGQLLERTELFVAREAGATYGGIASAVVRLDVLRQRGRHRKSTRVNSNG